MRSLKSKWHAIGETYILLDNAVNYSEENFNKKKNLQILDQITTGPHGQQQFANKKRIIKIETSESSEVTKPLN